MKKSFALFATVLAAVLNAATPSTSLVYKNTTTNTLTGNIVAGNNTTISATGNGTITATALTGNISGNPTVSGNLTVSGGSIVNGAGSAVYYFGTPSNNYMYYDGSSLYTRVGGSDRLTISGSTGNATFGGNLTVSGTGTIAGLTLSGGSFAAASLYKSASLGTVLSGATGSSYDLFISNPLGNHIIQTPTGTRGIEVAGNISSAGNITVSGTGSVIGDLSTFSNFRSIGATNTIRVRGNSQYIDFTNSSESGYVSGTIIANTLNLFGNSGTGLTIGTTGNAILSTNLLINTNNDVSAKVYAVTSDGAVSFGGAGGTKGIRIVHFSDFSSIEGVDSSLNASYQPLRMNGSTVQIATNGGTVAATFSSAQAVRLNAYGAGALTTDSSGNVTATSDERAKNIIGTFTKGLAEVVKLTPKTYTWKPETGLNPTDEVVSLTAQDLIAAGLPEAVSTYRTVADLNDDGTPKLDADGKPLTKRIDATYTVSDRAVIAALVNAVKELKAEVDALKAVRN